MEVNGLSGFKTTSGLRDTKRVIHRTLLVDGVSVWMLNLTDLTGGDPEISKGMLERIVASLNQPMAETKTGAAPTRGGLPRAIPRPPAGPGVPLPTPPGPAVTPAPAAPLTPSADEGSASVEKEEESGPPPPE